VGEQAVARPFYAQKTITGFLAFLRERSVIVIAARKYAASALIVVLRICFLASCKQVDKEALARSIDLQDVDLSTVADGTYEATYTIKPPVPAANKTVSVRGTVAAHAYQSIDIVKLPKLGDNKTFAALIARIKETRHVSIDAVSGATITSAAVLKAVQIAVGGEK
jgi:uncharacterized protein with FMN-binding domain